MNGRIRNFLPKHVRPCFLKQKDLDIIADILPNTPRQVLGLKTFKELFHAHLSEAPSSCCARKMTPPFKSILQ